jgi:hypothetical protein
MKTAAVQREPECTYAKLRSYAREDTMDDGIRGETKMYLFSSYSAI